jgi:DNA-binding Lrp family transcriptional regulator
MPQSRGAPEISTPKAVLCGNERNCLLCPTCKVRFSRLDRVDIGIIRWFMQGQPTAPFRAGVRPMVDGLARQLGVTGETVRNRVRRMFESGVLGRVTLQLNPAVLGMEAGALGMFVGPGVSRRALARRLSLVEGCQVVASHVDGLVGVVFYHYGGESLKKKVALMEELAGTTEGFYTDIPFPRCGLELTETDWRIVGALRPDASAPCSALSRKLGLSSRTVKRRLDRLVSGGAVFSMVSHRVRAVKGALEANLLVFYDQSAPRPQTDARILRELDDVLIYAGIWAQYSAYAVAVPSFAAGEEAAERVGRIDGVKEAWASVMEDRAELYESLDGFIARRAKGAAVRARARRVPVEARVRG